MKIQVLGSGCPTCKKLFEMTKQAVRELNLEVEIEYITDIQKILEMRVMSSPVLAIDGKSILVGQVPDMEKLKQLISSSAKNISENNSKCCSCGGNC